MHEVVLLSSTLEPGLLLQPSFLVDFMERLRPIAAAELGGKVALSHTATAAEEEEGAEDETEVELTDTAVVAEEEVESDEEEEGAEELTDTATVSDEEVEEDAKVVMEEEEEEEEVTLLHTSADDAAEEEEAEVVLRLVKMDFLISPRRRSRLSLSSELSERGDTRAQPSDTLWHVVAIFWLSAFELNASLSPL